MTKIEAQFLAKQLNVEAKTGGKLLKICEQKGWKLGLEHPSGDWVVEDANGKELARCA